MGTTTAPHRSPTVPKDRADRRRVYDRLAEEYAEFDEQPPDFRS